MTVTEAGTEFKAWAGNTCLLRFSVLIKRVKIKSNRLDLFKSIFSLFLCEGLEPWSLAGYLSCSEIHLNLTAVP